jgi:uncharacterized protein
MSVETAERALRVALSAPSPAIKIEFQGGEPLLNFPLIEHIVGSARRTVPPGKQLEFVIATNLALLDDDVLDFCRENGVLLSTSLDGPEDLHNRNRPRPGGNSQQLTVEGIQRAQAALGRDRIGALMTTTEASLDRPENIIDEYLRLDLDGIFLRPLSPYGFAIKTKQFDRYRSRDWLKFYERGLRYILDINKRGRHFPEFYASLLLRRILTDVPTGYVDLRSPAGIGLGALVYNYDGKVFPSDEGRMLAEMGDRTFELGDLATDDYASLILSDKLIELVGGSLSQCSPECASCAFEPYCGSDPVYHLLRRAILSASSRCPSSARSKSPCCGSCSNCSKTRPRTPQFSADGYPDDTAASVGHRHSGHRQGRAGSPPPATARSRGRADQRGRRGDYPARRRPRYRSCSGLRQCGRIRSALGRTGHGLCCPSTS